MRSPAELTQRFRDRNLKVTPQRQAVFRVLHENPTHPTADAVYEAVVSGMPTISLRTVYQTLNDLVDVDEIHRIELGTRSARFDPNVEASHHHLVCDGCGLVCDVFADTDGLIPPGGTPPGFEISGTDVVFRGVCEDCAASSDR
jgi:Fe2+ or Zn2+ uptake regulation protein